MYKKLKNTRGFTLEELLVSMFIIATMSTLFMVNYHNTNKRSELGVTKQKLASDIRLAQNYSLGSKTYDGANTPTGGWGVHFSMADLNRYIIFADKDGNHAYDLGEAAETKNLPVGITIDYLDPANMVDIIFLPPDPVTYINGANNINAVITLRENINNSTSTVSVNFFGLIDTD